eukprot:COSAG05_NODE_4853_length_1348_cov_0.926341_3_plen_108_part_01
MQQDGANFADEVSTTASVFVHNPLHALHGGRTVGGGCAVRGPDDEWCGGQDIDKVLKRAEEKTKTIFGQFEEAKKEGLSSDMWTFGGDDYKEERKNNTGGPSSFGGLG